MISPVFHKSSYTSLPLVDHTLQAATQEMVFPLAAILVGAGMSFKVNYTFPIASFSSDEVYTMRLLLDDVLGRTQFYDPNALNATFGAPSEIELVAF